LKFCTNCGNEIGEGVAFCTKCGRPVETIAKPLSGVAKAQQSPQLLNGPSATFQAPWAGALLLQNGESVTKYWYADHEVGKMTVVNGQRRMVKRRIRGYLALTTQRLVFIKERGLFAKSYHIDLSFSIDDLSGLSMGGLMMKYVSISDSTGEHIFHVTGVRNEIEFTKFRTLIQDQLVQRQQAIEAKKRRDRIQITLDFGFLRDYMSRGGLSLQVVKCPQCGAPMSLPKEGNQAACEHCGSTVFAQDIMEKVKQLIG
jgi:DNA-directed RNA polymerase subunit RPC12/RpoP